MKYSYYLLEMRIQICFEINITKIFYLVIIRFFLLCLFFQNQTSLKRRTSPILVFNQYVIRVSRKILNRLVLLDVFNYVSQDIS